MMAAIARRTKKSARTVLVVDGDDAGRLAFVAALEEARYVVCVASTRASALKLARELRPSIVVLERELPDGDGFKIIPELRRFEGMHEVPVIALTADEGQLTGSLEAGCDAFLEKPCAAEVLVVHVRRLLALRNPKSTGKRKRIDRE